MRPRFAALLVALAIIIALGIMRSRSPRATEKPTAPVALSDVQQREGQQQFYVLALSWAPNYCDDPSKPKSFTECGHHLGFIVHGLWLTNADGSQPDLCQGGSPIGNDSVNALLPYIPDRGLIAHEWKAHWSCHGTPQQFVDAVKQSVAVVNVPDAYQQPSQDFEVGTSRMEQDFAQQNGVPAEDFRISCYGGKLINFESCMSLDYKLQSCGGVKECPAPQVGLDAVK